MVLLVLADSAIPDIAVVGEAVVLLATVLCLTKVVII